MLENILKENRSCRSFDQSRKITADELKRLVNLTRYAPSAANRQPLVYRLVYKNDEVERLLEKTKWAAMLPELRLPPDNKHPAAFIAICVNGKAFPQGNFETDIGICAMTIYTAAAELGLAGCMIGAFDRVGVSDVLGLEERIAPKLLIALGAPAEKRKIVDVVNGSTAYYRDENGVHCVPKRSLEDILI